MKPFTHLFSSITSSSIWRSPKEVRLTWITMLAKANKNGEVWASVGGLADEARITRDECAASLQVLLSPDEDSRTRDFDGRRIVEIEGGWRLLNYKKYYRIAKQEDRREQEAARKRDARNDKCPQTSASVRMRPHLSAQEDRKSEGQRQLKRALRMKGLPTIGEAVQEWSDLLRGLCGATTLDEALEDLDYIIDRTKTQGLPCEYAKHCREAAEKRGTWRQRQKSVRQDGAIQ